MRRSVALLTALFLLGALAVPARSDDKKRPEGSLPIDPFETTKKDEFSVFVEVESGFGRIDTRVNVYRVGEADKTKIMVDRRRSRQVSQMGSKQFSRKAVIIGEYLSLMPVPEKDFAWTLTGSGDGSKKCGDREFNCTKVTFKGSNTVKPGPEATGTLWLSKDVKGISLVAFEINMGLGDAKTTLEIVGFGTKDTAEWGKTPAKAEKLEGAPQK